jgi:hypothetical protein
MRHFGRYAVLALCVCGLPGTAEAEPFGQWSLDQPRDFIFALSSKRTISFNDRTATSELAFVCNQENKHVAVLLIPLDGTFTSRHKATPVTIQKIEDQSGPSDLMQRWENGPGYMVLDPPDEQEELASYLKDREAEGLKSVHFISPTIWMRVSRQSITWSLTLRDFQAERRHLQAAANRRSSSFTCSHA